MFDLDRWTEIAASLRNNALRSFLTAAGVFWGMFMLVVMLGFGDGLEKGVKKDMSGYATNAVWVWGGRSSIPYRGRRPGRWTRYSNEDTYAIQQIDEVDLVLPRNQLGGWRAGSNVVHGGKTGSYTVMGDRPEFEQIAMHDIIEGRFINQRDILEHRKIAVLGDQVADELFAPNEDRIGNSIKIGGIYFQVVGVFRSTRSDDDADRDSNTIHLPLSTFQRAYNQGDRVRWFGITGKTDADAALIEEKVRKIISERHEIHPEDSEAMGSYNTAAEFHKVTLIFVGVNAFIWFVGTLTLAAGIVGVSNIMLIVVQERTKEIGLRRAIGATPFSVVSMVLQESVVLTTAAGYAGLVFAVAFLEVLGRLIADNPEVMFAQPEVDFTAALAAGVILLISGLIAGFIPAQKAAQIQPVEALHAE